MIIPPVEPIVLKKSDGLKAGAAGGPGVGAALKIPFAVGGGVQQLPIFVGSGGGCRLRWRCAR